MLIRNAEIWGAGLCDLRIIKGRIAAMGALPSREGEDVLDAYGGALLPGLHDHHIHLAALAAKRGSLLCGPPEVTDLAALATCLSLPGTGWLRGIGYYESVAGMLDAATLDQLAPDRPIRIQHRSGRMWFFNSAGLNAILERASPPPGLEKENGCFTGRLFDEDSWLRTALAGKLPPFAEISAELAAYGVTGITDMSPANDPAMAQHFSAEQASGALAQRCLLAGTLSLTDVETTSKLAIGPAKLHLHEADLPCYDDAVTFMRDAHRQDRAVAIHCTTETELVFTLSALEEAGPRRGDRIEHASIAPGHLVDHIAQLGLCVVSQPHFISERGDQYRTAIEAATLPHLYRLRSFLEAGVTLAGGSDAPFGSADPWAAMTAAVSRQTRDGHMIGSHEALSPEEAIRLFLADPADLPQQRRIGIGTAADLCLLDRPWAEARTRLSAADVRCTLINGAVIHNRVDQAPV